jgi:hypothetical protein
MRRVDVLRFELPDRHDVSSTSPLRYGPLLCPRPQQVVRLSTRICADKARVANLLEPADHPLVLTESHLSV